MSARRVASLTLSLPPSSRTMRRIGGSQWTLDQTLVGLAVERIDALTAVTIAAHGGKPPKQQPVVPRPKRVLRRDAAPVSDVLARLDLALTGGNG